MGSYRGSHERPVEKNTFETEKYTHVHVLPTTYSTKYFKEINRTSLDIILLAETHE